MTKVVEKSISYYALGISTSAHTKDLVIIAKRNTTQENKHKQKGKLEIKYLTCY